MKLTLRQWYVKWFDRIRKSIWKPGEPRYYTPRDSQSQLRTGKRTGL